MDIYDEIVRLRRTGQKCALATIVQVNGSIPSYESAKMLVRADGSIMSGGEAGSIHHVGKTLQGAPSCNGWTFWHVEHGGETKPLDALRQIYLLAVED